MYICIFRKMDAKKKAKQIEKEGTEAEQGRQATPVPQEPRYSSPPSQAASQYIDDSETAGGSQ
jgi:hypothetical protein